MDTDRLRALAERVRSEAEDTDEGAEESRVVADLFAAAASDDFQKLGDIREVRRAVHRFAEMVEDALTGEDHHDA